MDALPTRERQRWLIEQTARLVAACGDEQYLEAPLLEPTPAYFPENWAPDLQSAREITRRLLDHAALDALELELVDFVNEVDAAPDETYRHVAGFFAGIENGVCRFGINEPALEDPEELAGIMAHEVAHAFRRHHSLTVERRQEEEELTDLTTVFLGSGVLVANVSDRVVFHPVPGSIGFKRSSAGYLPPDELAFLLALQVSMRGYDSVACDRLAKLLGSSQRQSFQQALRELEPETVELSEALGLTSRTRRTRSVPPAAVSDSKRWSRPWGKVVYRAVYRHSLRGALLGFAGGWLVLFATRAMSALAVGMLAGAAIGSQLGSERCSECKTLLRSTDSECPGCAGYVIATLREPPHVFRADSRTSSVKRLRLTKAWRYAARGAFVGGGALIIAADVGFSIGWTLLCALLLTLSGAYLGAKRRLDLCSNPDCSVVLEPVLLVCPRCQGEIRGEISSVLERL